MASVYSNCALSLAALHGADSAAGCFTTRNPRLYLPCKIPVTRQLFGVRLELNQQRFELIGGEGSISVDGMTTAFERWSHRQMSGAPLLGRGWVFQERILPPRTIYFGAHGVYWECRTLQADDGQSLYHDQGLTNGKVLFDLLLSNQQSEEYHKHDWEMGPWYTGEIPGAETEISSAQKKESSKGEPVTAGPSNIVTKESETLAKSSGEDKSPKQPANVYARYAGIYPLETTAVRFTKALERDWSRIVENYSTKQFTNYEDKLIALQGLTDTVAARTGLTPYFGMWREFLFDELLWVALRPSRRLSKHHAPSFSWASLDGSIRRLHGAVFTGSTLRSSVLGATTLGDGRGIITVGGKFRCSNIPGNAHSGRMFNGKDQRAQGMTVQLDSLVDTQQKHPNVLFLVMVCFEQDDTRLSAQGLLLRPVAQSDNRQEQIENEHERIGVFEYTVPADGIPWWDPVDETGKPRYCKEGVLNIT